MMVASGSFWAESLRERAVSLGRSSMAWMVRRMHHPLLPADCPLTFPLAPW